jgi:acetyl esterase/lipase
MLDDRTGVTRTVPPHMGTLIWNARSNRYGWRSFLGQEPGTSSVPASAVPARTADLAGLPPTWIGVGGIDLFLEEDIDYARRLLEAGVPTELYVIPGAFHGFDIIAESSRSTTFKERKIAALQRALHG